MSLVRRLDARPVPVRVELIRCAMETLEGRTLMSVAAVMGVAAVDSAVDPSLGGSDPGRIIGTVFDDRYMDGVYGNGVRDEGESPMPGAPLSVYLDLNNDGWRDAAEPLATEPSPGEYAFDNLAPGTYTVRYNPALSTAGAYLRERTQTFPFERGGQTGHVVTVAAGEVSGGHDFGSIFANTPITGRAYHDRDRNGNRESEPYLDRVVYLDSDDDGVLDPDESRVRTVNRFGGPSDYLLPVLPGRSYTVRAVVPEGWTQSEPAGGAPYELTVDPQNSLSLRDVDFGMHRTAPAAVVGRHLFYSGSIFAGGGIYAATNDLAIPPDKTALLPGERATFANVSTYSRGINGLMIDLNDLALSFAVSQLFRFEVSRGHSDGSVVWTPHPQGEQITTVRRGAGAGASDRVVVLFIEGAIRNQWLRVTVLPGAASGLTTPDVFYFGHLPGDAGDASLLRVDAHDLAAVRRAVGRSADIDDPVDFNRDGRVDGRDLTATRQNLSRSLPQLTPTQTVLAQAATRTNGFRAELRRRSDWYTLLA